MSFKRSKERIYKIPNLLIGVLFIIFLIGVTLILVNTFFPNPISEVLRTSFFNNITNLSNIIAGALIASIVGLFTSLIIMDLKQEKDRDNLILSFYFELKEINEKIQKIPSDNINNCARWLVIENNPIYAVNGLFFVFRKEICELEPPYLEKILPIYSKILFIEQQWKNIHLEKPKIDPDILKILTQLKNEITDFLPILEEERQKIQ
jgi:hypothetical protein